MLIKLAHIIEDIIEEKEFENGNIYEDVNMLNGLISGRKLLDTSKCMHKCMNLDKKSEPLTDSSKWNKKDTVRVLDIIKRVKKIFKMILNNSQRCSL